jgi:hypothetical protein
MYPIPQHQFLRSSLYLHLTPIKKNITLDIIMGYLEYK